MEITEKLIMDTFRRLKPTTGGVWQDYFALLYLVKEFGLSEQDAIPQVAFGGNDYGVDAYHISEQLNNLYLFQFKWSRDHKLFGDSVRKFIEKGFEKIFGNPKQDAKTNPVIEQLKYALHEKKDGINKVFYQCVFRGNVESADNSKYLEALREDFESAHFWLDAYFGRKIELTMEFISVEQRRRGARVQGNKTLAFNISLRNKTEALASPHGARMAVGFLPLHELSGMFKAMGPRLLSRNVRLGLSYDNLPNREIRKSLEAIVLKGTLPAEDFAFHHNGICLSAQALMEEDGTHVIVEPRILNGAQTVTSLAYFLERQEKNPLFKKNEDVYKKIEVLAKIVLSPLDQAFITQVTINNNRQNPVAPWNLRANDDIQLQLVDLFQDRVGLFYERQQGAFESLSDEELEGLGVSGSKAVGIRPLAKALLALRGDLKRMSDLNDFFANEELYNSVFSDHLKTRDFRELVVCYKMGQRTNAMYWEIISKGENKYWYMDRAKNLLWALASQSFLNSDDRNGITVDYGRDLRLPGGFTDILRRIASVQLRNIIGETVRKYYQDQIDKEKTSFLRSTAMYEACMASARKMYGWERQSLGANKDLLS